MSDGSPPEHAYRPPIPLFSIDSDNGSEFINRTLLSWRDTHHITFTLTRPYKKNDNCFVEQKNFNDTKYRCIRNYVSYRRFDTPPEHQALARVYRSLCPLLNYFLPSVKLVNKQRMGFRGTQGLRQADEPVPTVDGFAGPFRGGQGGTEAALPTL
jgi:hypothetical protein